MALAAGAGAALLLTGNAASAADEIFAARDSITLPGGQLITSFDLGFVDPVIGLYLLADRTNKAVDVIDTDTNGVLVQLGGVSCNPPRGGFSIALVRGQARGV